MPGPPGRRLCSDFQLRIIQRPYSLRTKLHPYRAEVEVEEGVVAEIKAKAGAEAEAVILSAPNSGQDEHVSPVSLAIHLFNITAANCSCNYSNCILYIYIYICFFFYLIAGVEMFKKTMDYGQAGDNVGLLLRGVKREDVFRGQVVAAPGTVKTNKKTNNNRIFQILFF